MVQGRDGNVRVVEGGIVAQQDLDAGIAALEVQADGGQVLHADGAVPVVVADRRNQVRGRNGTRDAQLTDGGQVGHQSLAVAVTVAGSEDGIHVKGRIISIAGGVVSQDEAILGLGSGVRGILRIHPVKGVGAGHRTGRAGEGAVAEGHSGKRAAVDRRGAVAHLAEADGAGHVCKGQLERILDQTGELHIHRGVLVRVIAQIEHDTNAGGRIIDRHADHGQFALALDTQVHAAVEAAVLVARIVIANRLETAFGDTDEAGIAVR